MLEDDLAQISRGDVGILRVGSFPTASQKLLPEVLAQLSRRHPRLTVRLDEGEPDLTRDRLLEAELDIGLVYQYDLVPQKWPPVLGSLKLFSEELWLVLPAGHPLAQDGAAVALDRLVDEHWIATQPGTDGARCLNRLCAQQGFEPRIEVRTNDYDVIRKFVRSGLGIAIVPALGHSPLEGIVLRRVAGISAQRRVEVLFRNLKYNPIIPHALRSLVQSVRSTLAGETGIVVAESEFDRLVD